jgi:hypothetical protein
MTANRPRAAGQKVRFPVSAEVALRDGKLPCSRFVYSQADGMRIFKGRADVKARDLKEGVRACRTN